MKNGKGRKKIKQNRETTRDGLQKTIFSPSGIPMMDSGSFSGAVQSECVDDVHSHLNYLSLLNADSKKK